LFVVDKFVSEVSNGHLMSTEWIFPLVQTDPQFHPTNLLQTCFAFTNAPVLLTAGHYLDFFGDLKPHDDGLVHAPSNIKDQYIYSGVVHVDPIDSLDFLVYPVVASLIDSGFDLAVLLVDGGFPVTPSIPILEEPPLGTNVYAVGFPTLLQQADFMAERQTLASRIAFSDGSVLALHSTGTPHHWYPTVESDTWVSGGMSGGPLCSKNPTQLIGVNSTSFDGPDGPSWSTWLGKAMDRNFSFNAILRYADNSEFDLRSFTIRTLCDFAGPRTGISHSLLDGGKSDLFPD